MKFDWERDKSDHLYLITYKCTPLKGLELKVWKQDENYYPPDNHLYDFSWTSEMKYTIPDSPRSHGGRQTTTTGWALAPIHVSIKETSVDLASAKDKAKSLFCGFLESITTTVKEFQYGAVE